MMIKTWIIGFFLVTTLFNICLATDNSEVVRPRHHIFYVHGFGGNETSFGAMPEYLVNEIQEQQPEFKFESHYFHYGDSIDDNSIDLDNLKGMGIKETFAKYLGEFINEKVENIQPKDRISIIAHSQGGLIATIWIYNAALSNQPRFNSHLKNNLYSFITIGTPFWGSKIATLFTEGSINPLKLFMQGAMHLMFDKLDKAQLRDMSFASDSLREFHKNMILIPDEKLKALKKQVRFLNISGLAHFDQIESKFLQFFGGKYSNETDAAVSLPSSQIDNITLTDFKRNYKDGYRNKISKAKIRRIADTYISKGFHSLVNNGYPKKAIAAIPKACEDVNSPKCDHDIYKVIIDYLQGKKIPRHHPDINEQLLMGFTFELIVKLPKNLTQDELMNIKNKITVRPIKQTSEEDLIDDPNAENYGKTGRITLNRFWEPLSKVKIYRPADKIIPFNSLHIRVTGAFDLDYENDKDLIRSLQAWGDTLLLEVDGVGYKKRYIEFPIKPTYSVNLTINLERDPKYVEVFDYNIAP